MIHAFLIPARTASPREFHNVSDVTIRMGKACWHAACRHVRFQHCHGVKPHHCVCVRLQIRFPLTVRTKRPGSGLTRFVLNKNMT